jgi:hypothetical protein
MTDKRTRLMQNIGLSAFLSLPAGIVALMICIGSSPVDHVLPDWYLRSGLPLILIVSLSSFAAFFLFLTRKNLGASIASATLTGIVLAGLSIIAGLTIHRDFFTAAFQYILCIPAAIMFCIRRSTASSMTKASFRLLGNAGYILAGFYTEWLMLMGYAISTRAEPRVFESIVYNIYNLVLILVLFGASWQMKQRSFSRVEVGMQTLLVNGKDISGMVGPKKARLLHEFATAEDRRLRCPEIQAILRPGEPDSAADCATCGNETVKAAQCGRYRTTYNSVLDLKKMLEFLEIGTITTSANRRNILTDGWKLVLFEFVRLETLKKDRAAE